MTILNVSTLRGGVALFLVRIEIQGRTLEKQESG